MGKYWHFFKIGFQIATTYRANIFFRVLRHGVIVTLFVILWTTLLGFGNTFNGFDLNTLITYYILVEIVDIIYTQMPARRFNNDLKNGDLNNFLIKPINYWGYLLFYTMGHQLAASSLSVITAISAFVFFPQYLSLPASFVSFAFFLITCLLGFLISHQIMFTIGLLGFWISEVTHIRQGLNQLMGLFGGHWIPLAFFPPFLFSLIDFLPFKYLFNFPVKVFTNQVSTSNYLTALIIGTIWLILFLILGKITWRMGIKKYEAYGQ